MQVTCVHCGMEAAVTPEFHQCRHCHGDLGSLVTAEFKSTYYFRKAQESAAQGATFVALEQVQRGLQAQNRPDLHLLAAILYADLGREEQLRMHIGAIPTDDVLRPEAESLLKRLAKDRGILNSAGAAPPPPKASGTGTLSLGPRLMASMLTLVIVLGVVVTVTQFQDPNSFQFGSWIPQRWGELLREITSPIGNLITPIQGVETEQTPSDTPLDKPVPVTSSDLPAPVNDEEEKTGNNQHVPSVAEPAPELTSEQWREDVTQNVMGLIARETIDFTQILVDRGLTQLADSEIVGVVQGNRLVLMGSVSSPEAKQSVLQAVSEFDGVGVVDAYRLQVVLPLRSHVIRKGESLWGIAEEYLGDGSLWVEIVALNPDLELGALKAGETLAIPAQSAANTTQ